MIELFNVLDGAPPIVLPALLLMLAFGVLALIEVFGRP